MGVVRQGADQLLGGRRKSYSFEPLTALSAAWRLRPSPAFCVGFCNGCRILRGWTSPYVGLQDTVDLAGLLGRRGAGAGRIPGHLGPRGVPHGELQPGEREP